MISTDPDCPTKIICSGAELFKVTEMLQARGATWRTLYVGKTSAEWIVETTVPIVLTEEPVTVTSASDM